MQIDITKKLKLSLVLHCCWSGDNAPVQLGVSRLGVGIEACQLKVRDWVYVCLSIVCLGVRVCQLLWQCLVRSLGL